MRRAVSLSSCLAAAALASGCNRAADDEATRAPAPAVAASPQPKPPPDGVALAAAIRPANEGGSDDWRRVARPADTTLLGRLDQAWRLARAEAEAKGYAREVEALGVLVDPNAGQAGRLQPSPGDYRCKTVKLGSRGDGLPFVAYPDFRCRVELTPGGRLVLEKTTGSQRTRGLLYPDTEWRLVYVGAQAWGDETGFPAYGEKPARDQIGVFERIGADRWRLTIPFPKQESKLDILELSR